MGKCKPIYGKVSVFVAMRSSEMGRRYTVAQDSLRCYLKGTNYTLFYVDLSNDPEVRRYCTHENVFFRKHCAASVYLSKTDWMLVLDADTAVVNPNHCIEEYIDPRVDLVFYERFFNWEITAGNYLVKNTDFARRFLRQWADYEYNLPDGGFHGYDNGAIHIHVLRTVLPKAVDETEACQTLWANASDYDTYLAYVTCVKFMLGAVRVFPPMLRILKRGHGMARDGVLTNEEFCEADFMLHGYKQNSLDERDWESPFEKPVNLSLCGNGYDGWYWRQNKRVSCRSVHESLAIYERFAADTYAAPGRQIPHLILPEIGNCWPNCDLN